MCLKNALYSLFGQPGVCSIFILNKDCQSGALLKILPSSPSTEKFRLHIQKQRPFVNLGIGTSALEMELELELERIL